jgi:hypothetical protein
MTRVLPRWTAAGAVATAAVCAFALAGQGRANGAEASQAAAGRAAPSLANAGFTDTFGGAVNDAPGYGLNDSLAKRQSGKAGVTYTRESGLWYQAPPPQEWYSQVNHPGYRGALSFWLGTSAVRMDAPVVANAKGVLGVQATVNPVAGNSTSADWSSLVLSTNASDSGYVSNSDVNLGVLIRSNGGLEVFAGGTALVTRAHFAKPAAGGQFTVVASYTPGQRAAHINVNGSAVTVTAPAALPASGSLYMGAYLSASTEVSTLKNLKASAVNMTGLALPASSRLRYYGYYAARLAGPSHLAEVSGRSNLNWVNISDVDGYKPKVLNGCAADSCVVYTGNEFFSCDSQGNNCSLYPDYAARWQKLADAVKPHLGKIAAFYLLDEPQWHGATPAQITASAKLIKKTFPTKKVMMIEAGPEITPSLTIPAGVNWIGFDWYCQPWSTVEQTLSTLESLTASTGQGLFLVPEDAPLPACAGISGHQTDADIAALQWDYYDLAVASPRVIGLLDFGFWTSPAWENGGAGAASLPQTVDSNERAAARILAAAG